MNIGSGWERKSIMQRCPFIFIIRTENSRNNQTVGRKTTLRLRTSFQKPQALTLSSLAWRNRQQPTRIGRWGMVSDKVDFRTLSDGSKAYRSSELNIVVTYIDGVSQSEMGSQPLILRDERSGLSTRIGT